MRGPSHQRALNNINECCPIALEPPAKSTIDWWSAIFMKQQFLLHSGEVEMFIARRVSATLLCSGSDYCKTLFSFSANPTS